MGCGRICQYVIALVLLVICSIFYINESNMIQGEYKYKTNFNGDAKVYVEENGVARIVSENHLSAMYASGYYLASHRMWQMEYLRRLSQGRFSEILGKATIPLDENFRTLGLQRVCEEEMKIVDPKFHDIFDAYFQGINDYAMSHTLPLQFHAFSITFQNWTMVDSCTIYKLMGFMLAPDWGLEFARDYLSAVTKDEELINDLFSTSDKAFDENTEFILTKQELKDIGLYTEERPKHLKDYLRGNLTKYVEEVVEEILEEVENVSFEGSNAWVVSGEHTETGKPMISNDPHLGNGVPSIWYYSHIEYPDGKFASGATVPGIPLHVIFSTERVAFTITAIIADVVDIYEEKIIGDQYEFEGKLYPLEITEEIIKVKKKDDIHLKVRTTRHGPILPAGADIRSTVAGFGTSIMPKGDYSIQWGGLKPNEVDPFESLFKISQAQSVNEILDLVKNSAGVNVNMVFCDNLGEHGNIGYAPYGRYPKRTSDAGHRISRGWVAENEWDGFYDGEEKPFLLNPSKGFIVMANNPISTMNTKTQINNFLPGTARAKRITELLTELIKTKSGKISYEDFITVLSDIKDIYTEQKLPPMIKIVRDWMKTQNKTEDTVDEIIQLLEGWNFEYDKDMREPAYFTLWEFFFRNNFMVEAFKDNKNFKMKLLSSAYFDGNYIKMYEKIASNPDHYARYCSQYTYFETSNCGEVMYYALNQTIRYINRYYHNTSVVWGDLHPMAYPNIPFTRTYLKTIYDRETRVSGSYNTVNVASFRFHRFEGKNGENPYTLLFDPIREFPGVHSANLKIVSLMNGTVYYSLDTGVSESLISGYYFNMNKRHIENDLFKTEFPLSEELKKKGPDSTFVLRKSFEEEKTEDL